MVFELHCRLSSLNMIGPSQNRPVIIWIFLNDLIVPLSVSFSAPLYQKADCQLIIERQRCNVVSFFQPWISRDFNIIFKLMLYVWLFFNIFIWTIFDMSFQISDCQIFIIGLPYLAEIFPNHCIFIPVA